MIVAERIAVRAGGRKQRRHERIEAPMSIMYGQFFRSRPFTDADLPALLDLVGQANSDRTRTPYWHIGDVLWQMFRGPNFDPVANIRLWHMDNGTLVGFAWRDGPGAASLQRHPAYYGNPLLEVAMVLWIINNWSVPGTDAQTRTLTTYALDSDHERIERLKTRGFVPAAQPHLSRTERPLDLPIPDAPLPDGAVIRPIDPKTELEERVRLHRDVWANSAVTPASYRHMRAAPDYRADLDIVAVLPDHAFASYCICWFDPVSKIGEFEPVGTRAAYRRQGLATAVVHEGLRRLRAAGATTAMVYTVAVNPAANVLYEAAGFRAVDHERVYVKTWQDAAPE
jgi:mycothiol synthase